MDETSRLVTPRLKAMALKILKRRTENLAKYIEMGVPAPLLANAARLVGKCAEMLEPFYIAHHNAAEQLRQHKQSIGLCIEDGCDNDVLVKATPTYVGVVADLYGDSYCEEHAEQALRELQEEEEKADDDEAEQSE